MIETKATHNRYVKAITAFSVVIILVLTAGCGSKPPQLSNVDKTLILHGNMFNVSKFSSFSTSIVGVAPDGEKIDLNRAGKKQINNTLKTKGSPIRVTTAFMMDTQEVVYESRDVTSYSQFSSMVKNFESANKKFQKFMADQKQTQLTIN